jgi:hypothetical protein
MPASDKLFESFSSEFAVCPKNAIISATCG